LGGHGIGIGGHGIGAGIGAQQLQQLPQHFLQQLLLQPPQHALQQLLEGVQPMGTRESPQQVKVSGAGGVHTGGPGGIAFDPGGAIMAPGGPVGHCPAGHGPAGALL